MIGTVENRFVITVAPQKDICPQGSRYPMKASAMKARKMRSPIHQRSSLGLLNEP